MARFADHPASAWLLGAIALAIAAIGAKPYAGSWNDGSRLAAVESLVVPQQGIRRIFVGPKHASHRILALKDHAGVLLERLELYGYR